MPELLDKYMRAGKTTKPVSPISPWRAADHLKNDSEVAGYIEAMLEDGDPRAIPIALRTAVDAAGGMAGLAKKTGLSRETLYRTLSDKGNPRLDTLMAILKAYGLRISVSPLPVVRKRARRSATSSAPAASRPQGASLKSRVLDSPR